MPSKGHVILLPLTETERLLLEELLEYASTHFESDNATDEDAFLRVVLTLLAKVRGGVATELEQMLLTSTPFSSRMH